MGADGGVCWMAVRDPSRYERVVELLKPFYWLTYVDNYHWSNVEWIHNDTTIYAPNFLVGTYGTGQDFDLNSLREILDPEWAEELCIDPSLTFMELVDDLVTRPLLKGCGGEFIYLGEDRYHYRLYDYYDFNGCRPSLLERMLWDVVGTSYQLYGYDKVDEMLHPINNTRVCDWVDELRSLLNYQRMGSEETWT